MPAPPRHARQQRRSHRHGRPCARITGHGREWSGGAMALHTQGLIHRCNTYKRVRGSKDGWIEQQRPKEDVQPTGCEGCKPGGRVKSDPEPVQTRKMERGSSPGRDGRLSGVRGATPCARVWRWIE
eukprot:scaffold694_cov338-Pavlova_lutheri.AAC.39